MWGSNFLLHIRRPPPAVSHSLSLSTCLYHLVSINLSLSQLVSISTCLYQLRGTRRVYRWRVAAIGAGDAAERRGGLDALTPRLPCVAGAPRGDSL